MQFITPEDDDPATTQQVQFLQLVMNHIPQFIFWKDQNGYYKGCNINFARHAGFKNPEDLIGKNDYDMPWSREESDFFVKTDRRIMRSHQKEINIEEAITTAEGETRWVRTNKIPLFDDKTGEVIGILGTFEDVTERKEMELEIHSKSRALSIIIDDLSQSNQELEKTKTDLEQFTYASSHDLQEPLRMVNSFTSLLKRKLDLQLDESIHEYVDYITEGTERMSKLVRDIGIYAELGKVNEQFQYVSMHKFVGDLLQTIDSQIKEANTRLKISLPKEQVYCQPNKIKILFTKLIENSILYNSHNMPQVEISFQEEAKNWKFCVKDNGIGIQEKYFDLVFKPFKRLHNREKYMGSGIGLSMCQRIVDLHKGKIWIEKSEANRGSCFCFTLAKEDLF